MKLVKIRGLSELMTTKNIWQLGNGNIEHEEYGGTITPEMLHNKYVIDCDHNIILHDSSIIQTIYIYHEAVGSVPHKITLYGWMVNDLGKYIPSIDEIINSM